MALKLFRISFLFLLFTSLAACASAGVELLPDNPFTPTFDATVTIATPSETAASLPAETGEPPASEVPTQSVPVASPTLQAATETSPMIEEIQAPSDTPRLPPDEDDWENMPVIPQISARTIQIYQQGLEMGNDPHRFSKVGDCQNVSSYFLSPFEFSSAYRLGEFSALQETIDWYKGSFTRESLAVKGGFNVAAVLSPLRADPQQCEKGESPAQCELRAFNPSVAIVSMETWWSGDPGKYEKYMRQLLDYLISEGVVPILATKADNLEGEHQINKALALLSWEYDIPLWNFWASVQELPDGGLTEDGFHLTLGNYFYDDKISTRTGWSMRNLTALQALDAVRRAAAAQPLN